MDIVGIYTYKNLAAYGIGDKDFKCQFAAAKGIPIENSYIKKCRLTFHPYGSWLLTGQGAYL
ncbi:MAG TPA: hypothetical protein VFV08_07670 [Puia sp.]|nr:hypothetical protein [Puia sp.]